MRPGRLPCPVPLLGAALPALLYLLGASPNGYWLDSGEFVAAATWLGIAHPPGHPLYALSAHPLSWLPLGALPWRIALASALHGTLAAGWMSAAAWRSLEPLHAHPRLRGALAVTVSWWVGGSVGWWLQADRPEVYALQTWLGLAVLERLLAFEQAWPERVRGSALRQAALLFGLSLANHHLLGLLLLPAAAAPLARLVAARGSRTLLPIGTLALLGTLVYVYLPLRAHAPLALGEPDSLGRLWWVVSAQAFQGNTGSAVPHTLTERLADVAVLLADDLGLPLLPLLLVGTYLALRPRATRRLAAPWLLWLLTGWSARAWLGFIRSNPDALGYLTGAWSAATVLPLLGLLNALELLRPRRLPAAALALVALLLAVTVRALPDRIARAALHRFAETDPFDTSWRRRLPPHALVLLYAPQTVFRHWALRAVELSRPDVIAIPAPFLPYPGLAEGLQRRETTLRPLLAEMLLRGAPRLPTLQSLAANRPLLVELDPRVPLDLNVSLLAEGLYARALAEEAAPEDRIEAARHYEREVERLLRLLGPGPWRPETRAVLLWRHYVDALHFASVGRNEAARRSCARGLAIQPEARELRALDAALRDAEGPLDVRPFLPAAHE